MSDSATMSLTASLAEAAPLGFESLELGDLRTGLVIIDEVNGFATVGAGNLAPPAPNEQVTAMVAETDRLARAFAARGWPILATLDCHQPGKAEPPYPPHCERGTGEEELIPELKWLEDEASATLMEKDCINAYVGAMRADGSNVIADWVREVRPENLLVVGICTDICVMDFVLTMLSARNHGMLPGVSDILVYDRGCATYDLPRGTAEQLGYGATAAHPQDVTHHMGLYFMASRGARLVDTVSVAAAT